MLTHRNVQHIIISKHLEQGPPGLVHLTNPEYQEEPDFCERHYTQETIKTKTCFAEVTTDVLHIYDRYDNSQKIHVHRDQRYLFYGNSWTPIFIFIED